MEMKNSNVHNKASSEKSPCDTHYATLTKDNYLCFNQARDVEPLVKPGITSICKEKKKFRCEKTKRF